jgi:hypothetical protein
MIPRSPHQQPVERTAALLMLRLNAAQRHICLKRAALARHRFSHFLLNFPGIFLAGIHHLQCQICCQRFFVRCFQPDPESIDQDTPRSCAMHFSELVFQILYAAEIFAEQQICRPLSKNNIAAIGRE